MSYGYQELEFRFGHDRLTWGVQLLVVVNLAVLVGQLILHIPFGRIYGAAGGEPVLKWLAFNPQYLFDGWLWLPVSYMFLHSGLSHLFFNMLMLYFFGPDVERVLGSRQFLRFYFLCGIVGVLANFVPILLFGTSMNVSVIGASGATLGVLVAFAVLEPERQVFLFPIPVPIYAWMLVAIFVFINILTAVQPGSNMSVATHLGGMAVGFIYMKYRPRFLSWSLRRRKPKQRRGPSKDDMDKLGEEIDNIFKFQDKDRR